VRHDVLKLEVRRLRDILNAKQDEARLALLLLLLSTRPFTSHSLCSSLTFPHAHTRRWRICLHNHRDCESTVPRFPCIYTSHVVQVYGLTNRRFQLQCTIEERTREIQVHGDMLRAELKVLEDDQHRVALELKERQVKASSGKEGPGWGGVTDRC